VVHLLCSGGDLYGTGHFRGLGAPLECPVPYFHIDHLQSREGVPHERPVATAAGTHTNYINVKMAIINPCGCSEGSSLGHSAPPLTRYV
jgi:hypothetical protein